MDKKETPPPKPIYCASAGDAMAVLQLARWLGIPASYHPYGGEMYKRYVTVVHQVYVMAENLKEIISYMEVGHG